jgi:hypothetical protein
MVTGVYVSLFSNFPSLPVAAVQVVHLKERFGNRISHFRSKG